MRTCIQCYYYANVPKNSDGETHNITDLKHILKSLNCQPSYHKFCHKNTKDSYLFWHFFPFYLKIAKKCV